MILVDTSVWVDYLRSVDAVLSQLLQQACVVVHPMIVGELACGNLKNRDEVLKLLSALSPVTEASHAEVMHVIKHHALMGIGVGFVDMHLLSSCLLTGHTQFWTRDKRLARVAESLGIVYSEAH